MADLTPRQAAVLELLERLTYQHGYPPTVRELARELQISHVAVIRHLAALARKGKIHREEATARGIVVVR